MKGRLGDIDAFDRAYCDRIRNAVWEARDPATQIAQLRNNEIYDALLQLQAMILASSKDAGSSAKMRDISGERGEGSIVLILSKVRVFHIGGVRHVVKVRRSEAFTYVSERFDLVYPI